MPDFHIGNFLGYPVEKYKASKKDEKKKKDLSKPTLTKEKWDVNLRDVLLKFDTKILLHLFHKLIWFYGESNTAIAAKTHEKKISTVFDVVSIFLKISKESTASIKGSISKPFVHSPEVNKLMDLFGEWIVEACDRDDNAFSNGRAIAYQTFSNMICTKSSQPIEKKYLANFYRAIFRGLSDKGTDSIKKEIFLHSWRLFSFNYYGSKVLIPYYIKVSEKILQVNSKFSIDHKLAVIKFYNSIINLCYYMNDFQLPSLDNEKPDDYNHFHLVLYLLIKDENQNFKFNKYSII
jgi:hypothetical protein